MTGPLRAFTVTCAVLALLLSFAALAVSLLHVGPQGPPGLRGARGPTGPQGNPGKTAQASRFGICWSEFTQTGSGEVWVSSISIDQPVISNGVYTCPQGDTFVSIVPQPSQAAG